MTTQTITIPAREVRPGDVLFGMTVEVSHDNYFDDHRHFIATSVFAMRINQDTEVTVERPVPSDPIGTVRARFNDEQTVGYVFRKYVDNLWYQDGSERQYKDADVADFPILWKPGMPIPTEGAQA